MGERTDAKRSIESSARHMTDIAHELSRRASPRYLGEQAKETALNKTLEWKDEIISSPIALGLIGGALGAAIGGSIARGRRTSVSYRGATSRQRSFSSGRGGAESRSSRDLGDEVSSVEEEGITDKLAGRAQELKDKAANVVTGVREQLPSTAELSDMAEENPMLVALGGLALGAIAALLLPVTRKERELLEPVKQQATEAIGSLGEKIGDVVEQAQDKIAGSREESSSMGAPTGGIEGRPLTH
jgi:hypothetical protein